MSRILIDDREYEVDPQHNLLQAILSLGLDLPYFCWHPALGSVGSCRQCAVTQYQDENDRRGRLVVACMTPVQDGMRIGLDEAQARDFRATVIEALMTNHPHDCPVCEEGGECHLQDMTEMSGHTFRRYRGLKRTHRNQYLGPFINHEMNRCIACYRCVRFYRDYAGGEDLGVQAAHHHVYFGRDRDGVLQSPFSGNLVEVCPTGVFTDRTYSRHFSRKWDLQCSPSVCAHCAVGCNTFAAERYGRLVRITDRYQRDLNGYFLCDRGRFGYDFQNAPQRLAPDTGADAALDELLRRIADPRQAVFAIGSPRASLENNFALACLVGEERFHAGIAAGEWRCLEALLETAARQPLASLREIEQCDAALVIGEDITATAPRVALSLRQLIRNRGIELAAEQKLAPWQDAAVRSLGQWQRSPLWQLVPGANALDDCCERQRIEKPGDISRLAQALALYLEGGEPSADTRVWVEDAARMLRDARKPLLLAGCGLADPRLLRAAARIAAALHNDSREPRLYLAAAECNSVGLAALCRQGLDGLFARLEEARQQELNCTLVVLENDLEGRLAPEAFERLRAECDRWLVLDCLETTTTQRADAVVPVPSAFEQQGTLVNASGMLQRFEAAMAVSLGSPWRRFVAALERYRAGHGELTVQGWLEMLGWRRADDLRRSLAQRVAALSAIEAAGPAADYRVDGRALARQSPRYGGRTAITAGQQVREGAPAADPDSPYRFSMEGAAGAGGWRGSIWAPGWNSVQALNRFLQEVGGDWRDGHASPRLDAAALGTRSPGQSPEDPAQTDPYTWLPQYEVFAGETLSDAAAAVRERAGDACLLVDPGTALQLELETGDSLELAYADRTRTLYVRVDPSLPPGCVAVPQRAGFWRIAADPRPDMRLQPAREPLPKPPRLIASDRENGHG